jgi:hypothetical protein
MIWDQPLIRAFLARIADDLHNPVKAWGLAWTAAKGSGAGGVLRE